MRRFFAVSNMAWDRDSFTIHNTREDALKEASADDHIWELKRIGVVKEKTVKEFESIVCPPAAQEPKPVGIHSATEWALAPDWAKFHAFDKDGAGYWYSQRPWLLDDIWDSKPQFGRSFLIKPSDLGWSFSLVVRPTAAAKEAVTLKKSKPVKARTKKPEPLSSASDWSKAPEWANYHAFDSDGRGFWYGTAPRTTLGVWASEGKWDTSRVSKTHDGTRWQDTLVERPK